MRRLVATLAALLCGCAAAPPAAPPPPLLQAAAKPADFADNPIVYFVIPDRFENGNPANDHAHGRQREADPALDVGTFHGGDLKGLTKKLQEGWFSRLGVNAIWITAPYEQIHGWVVGGNKAFKHYAYHGYYALDYSVLDRNMGTPDELREMVDTAHAQGIRVLFDVVMNHPGYLDIRSAQDLGIKVLWPGAENATPANYHSYIDYNSFAFGDWWGRAWVRANLPGYIDPGRDDLTMQLAFLADFRTDSSEAVGLPKFLRDKPDTRAVELPNTTVRGYLVKWLTDWVRDYGIDGFRADTVKHVEPESWRALKQAAVAALAEWKAKHPGAKIDDAAFWMTGEHWGQGPEPSPLAGYGFDSLINFDFQTRAQAALADPEPLYAAYASLMQQGGQMPLSYLSSHDTELFDRRQLVAAGALLLLAPGGVQIYYGDETARPPGPSPAGDAQQATRSDMNWASVDGAVLAHWRTLGTFRAKHPALARGVHRRLSAHPYAFSRVDVRSGDKVVVAMEVRGQQTIPIGGVFADGVRLRDAYSGALVEVAGGSVRLDAQGYVLLEAAPPAGR